MKDNTYRLSAIVVLAVILATQPLSNITAAENVLPRGQDEKVVGIGDLQVKESGEVSGVLVNKSSPPLRDIQLLIRYTWHWKNELRPQEDTLSKAVYHTVEAEISPQGRATFQYKPTEALPSRSDGYFETSVAIAGFTEVIRPPQ